MHIPGLCGVPQCFNRTRRRRSSARPLYARLRLHPQHQGCRLDRQLGSEPAAQWIVITGDQRIRKNLAERAAWIKAGLKAFVLAPVYQKTPINQGASVLLWRWPQMKAFVKQAAPGSMFELAINRRNGFVPLAFK